MNQMCEGLWVVSLIEV